MKKNYNYVMVKQLGQGQGSGQYTTVLSRQNIKYLIEQIDFRTIIEKAYEHYNKSFKTGYAVINLKDGSLDGFGLQYGESNQACDSVYIILYKFNQNLSIWDNEYHDKDGNIIEDEEEQEQAMFDEIEYKCNLNWDDINIQLDEWYSINDTRYEGISMNHDNMIDAHIKFLFNEIGFVDECENNHNRDSILIAESIFIHDRNIKCTGRILREYIQKYIGNKYECIYKIKDGYEKLCYFYDDSEVKFQNFEEFEKYFEIKEIERNDILELMNKIHDDTEYEEDLMYIKKKNGEFYYKNYDDEEWMYFDILGLISEYKINYQYLYKMKFCN